MSVLLAIAYKKGLDVLKAIYLCQPGSKANNRPSDCLKLVPGTLDVGQSSGCPEKTTTNSRSEYQSFVFKTKTA